MLSLLASARRPRWWLGRLVDSGAVGRFVLAGLALVAAFGCVGLWLHDGSSGAPELLLMVPVVLCVLGYGLRGGVVSVAVALAPGAGAPRSWGRAGVAEGKPRRFFSATNGAE